MNPRHRRLLIPGLLIALLVVVAVATLMGRADAATSSAPTDPAVACTLTDDRIDEQSGLAVSAAHPDTAYVVNDSGSDPEVYAVDLISCEVVGVTELEDVPWRDPEAMALDGSGTLWIADTGDNNGVRDDARLYSMPEPGREGGSVRPEVHPIAFETGREDVEALLVDPTSDAKWVVTKGWTGGELLALPDSLPSDAVSTATSTGVSMPILVTDASMTPDGHYAVVRTYLGATLYDVREDFAQVASIELPTQPQGETLAIEPAGTTFLVGSEGVGQPLYRLALQTPEPVETPATTPAAAETESTWSASTLVWVAGVTIVGLFAGALLVRRRRRP